jgi:UDP-N-acetylmuramate dehydrogenase
MTEPEAQPAGGQRAAGKSMTAIHAAADVLGDRVRRDVPLGPLTTYRVGGTAALFVEAHSLDDLTAVRAARTATGVDLLVVGKGSNLLVADAGFAGLVVILGDTFAVIDINGLDVRAGGAAPLPVVARRTAAAGLTGFEWAVGVPGSVGGGVRMNAGGHGAEIRDSLVDATIVDLDGSGDVEGRLAATDLAFGYRRSAVEASHVVTAATFRLSAGDRAAAEARIADIVQWRRDNQPGGQNAGSVFTNPPGDSAGRLIDAAGLKGLRVGTAQVSEKHANFIQADSGGSADDVRALIREVQQRVREAMGVALATEVMLIGFAA